jgi:hypothetical protein
MYNTFQDQKYKRLTSPQNLNMYYSQKGFWTGMNVQLRLINLKRTLSDLAGKKTQAGQTVPEKVVDSR